MLNNLGAKSLEKGYDYEAFRSPTDFVVADLSIQRTRQATGAEAVTEHLERSQQEQQTRTQSQPVLPEPTVSTSDPGLYTLLGALREILLNGIDATTEARMGVDVELGRLRATTYDEALEATAAAREKYQNALTNLDAANEELIGAKIYEETMGSRLQSAQQNFDAKKETLRQREKELAMHPDDEGVQQKRDNALAEFEAATTTLNTARQNFDSAAQTTSACLNAVLVAQQDVADTLVELNACLDDEQRVITYDDALAATAAAKERYQEALTNLDTANGALSTAKLYAEAMGGRLQWAQDNFNTAKEALRVSEKVVEMYPDDPHVLQKRDAALAEFEAATITLNAAQQNFDSAQQTMNDCLDAAIAASQAVTSTLAEVNDWFNTLNRLSATETNTVQTIITAEEIQSAMKVLMDCMLRLSELMASSNEDRLRNNLQLYREKQDKLQKECEKKSADFRQAIKDAEEAQRKMKLISKFVSWAVAVISAAAAIATGGGLVALVPAAAALAFAVTDEVLDSQGKEALSTQAMAPIMNGLLEGLTHMLQEMDASLSEEDAQMIAMVLAAIILVVAVAAASKAGGAATDALAKLSPALKDAMAKLSSIGAQGLLDPSTAGKAATYVRLGAAAAEISNGVAQTGMQISAAYSMQDARYTEASLKENQAVLEIIKRIIQEVVENYCQAAKDSNEFVELVSNLTSQGSSTARAVTRNIAAAA